MSLQLQGKAANQVLLAEISADIPRLSVVPTLATVRLGDNGADIAYQRNATQKLENLGLKVKNYQYPIDFSQEELLEELERLNQDASVHGILLFQPLPPHLDMMAIRHAIAPEKDIDCTTVENLGLILAGETRYAPCAPGAVMALLDHYQVSVVGKKVTIIGRSLVVGRPLSMLLLVEHATISVCNVNTANIAEEARNSDILITAAGCPGLVTPEFVHPKQTVIDIGTTMVDGVLCGDIHPDVIPLVAAYTPTPGGIGALTTTILARQLVKAVRVQEELGRKLF